MRINKTVERDMIHAFESALDYIPALDKVPFHIKRLSAIAAARAALEYLKEQ